MNLEYGFTDVFYGGRNITTSVLHNEEYKFHQAACHFLLEVAKKSKSGSKATVKSRASDLTRYLNTIAVESNSFFDNDYREITERQMSAYLMDLQNNKLADSTIVRHISTLSEFYSFAYEYGYIDTKKQFSYSVQEQSARLQLSHQASSQVLSQYISEDDFKNILAQITAKNTFKRWRDEFALKVGYFLGVRAHELVEPKYGNFDIKKLKKQFPNDKAGFFEEGFIKITGKGYKRRSVPICMELKKDLWRFLYGDMRTYVGKNLFEKNKGVPLVDTDYGTNIFGHAREEYLSNNVISSKLRDSYNRWSFHSLRHTCATNFVTYCENTKSDPFLDIPQWMGHSDEKTTKLYICSEALLNQRLERVKQLDSMSAKTATT
jgi:site-specific recombinase XerD